LANLKRTTAAARCVILGRNVVVEMSVKVNDAEVRRWLREAEPGQSIRYFEGCLGLGTDPMGLPLPASGRQAMARVADRLWRAAQHDLVHLVQRRQGPTNWAYIAIARPPPRFAYRNGDPCHMERHDG